MTGFFGEDRWRFSGELEGIDDGDPEMVYYQDATPDTSVTEIGRIEPLIGSSIAMANARHYDCAMPTYQPHPTVRTP